MKKIILLALVLPFFAGAQTERSLLWKVTKEGSENTSFLFGSIHTNDSILNTFDQTWWNAFNSCDVFVGEVSFFDTNELMASLAASTMKDSTLKDFYSEAEFLRVQAFINSKFDLMTSAFIGRMKPFYIMAAIMELPSGDGPYKEIMDQRLQNVAHDNGKKIFGLETSTEQAVSIDVISLREQSVMLLEFVDGEHESDREAELMQKHYYSQNLDSLKAMEAEFEAPAELIESIVTGRNNRFVQRLLPHLNDASVFCAVGALHLPGQTGLIEQLRKNGFTVLPVIFKFAK